MFRTPYWSQCLLVSLCLLPAESPGAVAIQACDPSVVVDTTDADHYAPVGDRCEGSYVRLVSGVSVYPVSLTRGPVIHDSGGPALSLSWGRSAGGPVRVQAISTGAKHYRMDAWFAATEGYPWRSPRLARSGLPGARIGILAWSRREILGANVPVYLPVLAGAASPGPLRLRVMTEEGLDSVLVSIGRLSDDGRRELPVVTDRLHQEPPYPRGGAFTIVLPEIDSPGLYRIVVSVVPSNHELRPTAIQLWILQQAETR